MTLESQRIAIATACGWTDIKLRYLGNNGEQFICGVRPNTSIRHGYFKLPDYLSDLNACASFPDALTHEQLIRYTDLLTENGGVHATAPQRCEAFLRTLNLWSDDK